MRARGVPGGAWGGTVAAAGTPSLTPPHTHAAAGWYPADGKTALSMNNTQMLMRQIACHPFGLAEPYLPQ